VNIPMPMVRLFNYLLIILSRVLTLSSLEYILATTAEGALAHDGRKVEGHWMVARQDNVLGW
jgi:hypothetical protein